MDVNLLIKNAPIVIVALITWGGVLAYLFRLEALTRAVEKQAELARESRENSTETEM